MRQTRDYYQRFYRSTEWRGCRVRHLRVHPACVRCRRVRTHMAVDHILPLRTHWSKRLDPANLQTLCPGCHRGKHREDLSGYRTDVDATGWPTDTRHPIHTLP